MKKIVLWILIAIPVINSCNKEEQNNVAEFSQYQQNALKILYGTFEEYTYSYIGNSSLPQSIIYAPTIIEFTIQYEGLVPIFKEDIVYGEIFIDDMCGECNYKVPFIDGYETNSCYFSLDEIAGYFSLYEKETKKLILRHLIIFPDENSFNLLRKEGLPYNFKRKQ